MACSPSKTCHLILQSWHNTIKYRSHLTNNPMFMGALYLKTLADWIVSSGNDHTGHTVHISLTQTACSHLFSHQTGSLFDVSSFCSNFSIFWPRKSRSMKFVNMQSKWAVSVLLFCVRSKEAGKDQSLYWLRLREVDDRGWIPDRGGGILFLFATVFRPALRPAQPLLQCVPGLFPLKKSNRGVKLTKGLHVVPRLRWVVLN